jgi:uncharacterized protein (TIGR02757 family)
MQTKEKYILSLKKFLDEKVEQYNTSEFIISDPVSIPHRFTMKQDVEIMGFFAAIFAWGQRKTIINKCIELIDRMDNSPYDFIVNHQDADLQNLIGFKHRTFNDTDLLYCVDFMKRHYQRFDSLEDAFFPDYNMNAENALNYFHQYFFSHEDAPLRTRKHIPYPIQNSACKRLNLFLRWMVRKDDKGVDFGIWHKVLPKDLVAPLDLHVERTARVIGLLQRDKADWKAALELTENFKLLDPTDPVKYDYALFCISVEKMTL